MTTTLTDHAIKYSYFDIFDYLDRLELNDTNKMHAKETLEDYENYIRSLSEFSNDALNHFFIKTFYDEIKKSKFIDNPVVYPEEIINSNIIFDKINHVAIKNIHYFSEKNKNHYEYRDIDAWVRKLANEEETIFWYGANPEDIEQFMNDFINFYKSNLFDENMILKSILVHLIFVRIHPFKDGNSRTTRLLSDIKLLELTNKAFNNNFSISPIHLSNSIYRNITKYKNKLANIYFDNINNPNMGINDFIEYMLNLFDEEIFYMTTSICKSRNYLLNSSKTDIKIYTK